MQTHSKTAWDIASRYSAVLASETRDLAAAVDKAIGAETHGLVSEIERLRAEFGAIVEYCERDGISAVERLRAVRNAAEQATRHLEQTGDGK